MATFIYSAFRKDGAKTIVTGHVDAVDLIEEMPSDVVERILKNTRPSDRKVIEYLLFKSMKFNEIFLNENLIWYIDYYLHQ